VAVKKATSTTYPKEPTVASKDYEQHVASEQQKLAKDFMAGARAAAAKTAAADDEKAKKK
jgi:hypothetical protein